MFEEFDIHNQFNESITRYKEHDPHLKRLSGLPLVYHSPLLDEPIFDIPGIKNGGQVFYAFACRLCLQTGRSEDFFPSIY